MMMWVDKIMNEEGVRMNIVMNEEGVRMNKNNE